MALLTTPMGIPRSFVESRRQISSTCCAERRPEQTCGATAPGSGWASSLDGETRCFFEGLWSSSSKSITYSSSAALGLGSSEAGGSSSDGSSFTALGSSSLASGAFCSSDSSWADQAPPCSRNVAVNDAIAVRRSRVLTLRSPASSWSPKPNSRNRCSSILRIALSTSMIWYS